MNFYVSFSLCVFFKFSFLCACLCETVLCDSILMLVLYVVIGADALQTHTVFAQPRAQECQCVSANAAHQPLYTSRRDQ
ncbi:agip5 [Agrotis ipsilon multiple nucleopolyhedrovirus]|uniref:Uncharacterized protein n=1 Tax=Agrotis ipsilon multiple nucleopolyhedrovirus TaxID=208013 RepID=B6D5R9_9ABAC|nr:agip5 [Agrotis ipsilon multiple nucleopolyhedrovirus]ACI28707.1 unknown [Agrotis ipsilon multiple nucleopolyhedrovirus]